MTNAQLNAKLPKRARMKGKRYNVAKRVNDHKVSGSLKVAILRKYAPLIPLGDLKINQLYKNA